MVSQTSKHVSRGRRQERAKVYKQLQAMTFETEVKQSSNSGRIIIPKSLVGKNVKVTLEVI
jgi:putative transposon-encoded protein